MNTRLNHLLFVMFVLGSGSLLADENSSGKKVEIDSKSGQESVTIQESQTGDQSNEGTAVTDDPVDDHKTTDEDDNTDEPKYKLKATD